MMMRMMNSLKSDWKCQEWAEELENMKEHEFFISVLLSKIII